jgi:hypothetical protein
MHEEVAQIDHLPPGDRVMLVGDLGGNVVCGFADNSQVVNDGVEEFFVVFERLEIDIGSKALDPAIASRMSWTL